jgi:hypothetical protein
MKAALKYIVLLIILATGIILASIILRNLLDLKYRISDVVILSAAFSLISAVTLLVFFRGAEKKGREKGMHSFVAVSVKFLAELLLVLGWFVIAKKSSAEYVILFFVLYLSFSMFSFGLMMKTLKNKSLHRDNLIENN